MFCICYVFIKNYRFFSDFIWICDLDEMKGYDLVRIQRNIEFQKIVNQIKNIKFLFVIGDGLIDLVVKEQEMWFVRGCRVGIVIVDFIGVYLVSKVIVENIVYGL